MTPFDRTPENLARWRDNCWDWMGRFLARANRFERYAARWKAAAKKMRVENARLRAEMDGR